MTGELRDNPCKDCSERSVGCHSRCDKYREWRKIRDLMLEEEAKEKALSLAHSEMKQQAVMKSLRHKSKMSKYRGKNK